MRLHPHHIHVWSTSLAIEPAQESDLLALLSQDERERVHRIRLSKQRQRFIAARGTLRVILSNYLSMAPQDIVFAYAEHQKPCLASPNPLAIQFNLAHSGDVAVYAVTVTHPVGIDIEKIEPDHNPAIARRYFSPQENQQLSALPKSVQSTAFYTLWSRKEALVKAVGKGLTLSLASFNVSADNVAESILLENAAWSLAPLPLFPGFACSLATKQSIEEISCWRLTEDGYIMIRP